MKCEQPTADCCRATPSGYTLTSTIDGKEIRASAATIDEAVALFKVAHREATAPPKTTGQTMAENVVYRYGHDGVSISSGFYGYVVPAARQDEVLGFLRDAVAEIIDKAVANEREEIQHELQRADRRWQSGTHGPDAKYGASIALWEVSKYLHTRK